MWFLILTLTLILIAVVVIVGTVWLEAKKRDFESIRKSVEELENILKKSTLR